MSEKLSELIRVQEQLHARRRLCRNAANGLMFLAEIDPLGKGLICLLGSGKERTNAEAITHWVGCRAEAVAEVQRAGNDVLDYLYAKLLSELPEEIGRRR